MTNLDPMPSSIAAPEQETTQAAALGMVDTFEGGLVIGWAVSAPPHSRRAHVQMFIDGKPVASVEAARFRGDLLASGVGDGFHGFVLEVPKSYFDGEDHEILICDAAAGLPLGGCPVLLRLDPQRAEGLAELRASVPQIRGGLDECTPLGGFGWAASVLDSSEPLELNWILDGKTQGTVIADRPRRDLLDAGMGHGRYGFVIDWPDELFDGKSHVLELVHVDTGEQLVGSPTTLLLSPLQLWSKLEEKEGFRRRQVVDLVLNFCEGLDDSQLNAEIHGQLTEILAWLGAHGVTRHLRRFGAMLDRMLRQRCQVKLDGMLDYKEIGGVLLDRWAQNTEAPLLIELLEGDAVVASAECKLRDEGAQPGRFIFKLPDPLLDDEIHRLGVRIHGLGGTLGPWSFLLARPRGDEELIELALAEPGWEGAPAVVAARQRRRKRRTAPTAVEHARESLADAIAQYSDSPAPIESSPATSWTGPGDSDSRPKPTPTERKLLDAHCRLGSALRATGEWAEATASFREALHRNSEFLPAISGLVNCLLDAGDEEGALDLLDEAMSKLPSEGELHSLRDGALGRRRLHKVRTLAFFLPQFHPTPENNAWWGEGFTEWHNVTGAAPLFNGHMQPRRPTALGYYDLRLPESANAQFDLARRYGIDGFCYYYYWFEGRRVLSRPLDDLVAGRTGPFPFCICWANEDWTRAWDGATGEILLGQNHSAESDFRFIQDLAPILRHPDYVRVDGKPMVLVYRANKLATPKATAERWRAWCREQGIGELHLCAVQSFGFEDPRPLGFDAAVEFPPHAPVENRQHLPYRKVLSEVPGLASDFRGQIYDYQAFARAAIARPRQPYTLHRTSMVAWDNSARRTREAHIFHWFSLSTFERWHMTNARRCASEQADAVCFVNAWNEWAEGSVLEPDSHLGRGPLLTIQRASQLTKLDPVGTYWIGGAPALMNDSVQELRQVRVLLVGHDAHASGAQTNMLNMVRSLRRQLGADVSVMLLEGGEILPDYERAAPTLVLGRDENWRSRAVPHIRQLHQVGYTKAICNTVVTGDVVELLKQEGFRVVSLVHEMPALIESYALQPQCWRVAGNADAIVCASNIVAQEFSSRYWPDPKRLLIAPQGIAFNPYVNDAAGLRLQVRKELGLASAARIVIGCGYGDTRKGIDLFVQLAGEVARQFDSDSVAFVWVGSIEPTIRPYVMADVERLGLRKSFCVTERTPDPFKYLIAADLFALTSREDPFPSVVMEAFDAALPVVAFDGGGGYVDIVGDASGALVPYLDVGAMSLEVQRLLGDEARRAAVGQRNHQWCRTRFGYEPYMRKLLALLSDVPAEQVAAGHLSRQAWFGPAPRPTITVIVPNFNYARFLELRLRTVVGQTLLPDEIIVLDDASTDGSLEVINAIAAEVRIPITVLRNEANTGNPFVQWSKGLELAKSDLVWIAEADDYCEPTLLETLARELADPEVVMCWSDSVMVDASGLGHGSQYKNYYAKSYGLKWLSHFRMNGTELIRDCLLTENVVPNASAVLFRRTAVTFDLQPMQTYRFSGDWWFWLSLARQGDVVYRAEPLNYHRRHQHSVMGEVLRAGQALLKETMGFYERVIAAYPECLTIRNVRSLTARLEQLYSTFPKLQQSALRLREHRDFAEQWQRLAVAFKSAEPATRDKACALWLVISSDVLGESGEGLRRLVASMMAAGGRILVLAAEANGKAWADSSRIDSDVLTIVEPAEYAGVKSGIAQEGRSIDLRLVALLEPFIEGHVFSHGLLAHCVLARVLHDRLNIKWTLVAGSDFDALLGRPPARESATLAELRLAVNRADSLCFLGEAAPHALGRMAQEQMRALHRFGDDSSLSDSVDASRAKRPARLIASPDNTTAEICAKALQDIALDYPDPASRPLLQVLAWGHEAAMLRAEITPSEDLEIVDSYGPAPNFKQSVDRGLVADAIKH